MKLPHDCQNMTDIREAIDIIDNKIIELIASRSQFVKAAAQFKKDANAVRDPDRVKKVIASKKELAIKYNISSVLIENMYTMMIDFFINEEMNEYDKRDV